MRRSVCTRISCTPCKTCCVSRRSWESSTGMPLNKIFGIGRECRSCGWCMGSREGISGLCGCGWEYGRRLPCDFGLCLYVEWGRGFVECELTGGNKPVNNGIQVCGHCPCCQRSALVTVASVRGFFNFFGCHNSILGQPICYHPHQGPLVSHMHQAHQHAISFYSLDHQKQLDLSDLLPHR